jgi:hypothetical protein
MKGSGATVGRPPKMSSGEIFKELGCATAAEFFEKISDHGSKSLWDMDDEEGFIYAEDFTFNSSLQVSLKYFCP